MKKLMKKSSVPNTVEAFACTCLLDECSCQIGCSCPCYVGPRPLATQSNSVSANEGRASNKSKDTMYLVGSIQVR